MHAPTRETAIVKMIDALHNYKILGVKTSKKFMVDVLNHPDFIAGKTYTNFIEKHMSEREIDWSQYKEIAAALASAASLTAAPAVTGGGGMREKAPSPWQTIGSWEIGDSIHE